MPELWGGSADLAGSNNTTIEWALSFLPKDRSTKMFQGDPYPGRVLHFGIREHGMGAIMNGIAAHGADPRLRRHVPHVLRLHAGRGARRGDGHCRSPMCGPTTPSAWAATGRPTSRSSTWRRCAPSRGSTSSGPADANETAACWQTILEHTDRPAALALSRQNVPVFPRGERASPTPATCTAAATC